MFMFLFLSKQLCYEFCNMLSSFFYMVTELSLGLVEVFNELLVKN